MIDLYSEVEKNVKFQLKLTVCSSNISIAYVVHVLKLTLHYISV